MTDVFEHDPWSDDPMPDRKPYVAPLYYGQVHKYLEQLERSLGKALSDHPDRQEKFDKLWGPCVRHATFNEVYLDVEDHCHHFYGSLLETIYLEDSSIDTPANSINVNNDTSPSRGTFPQVEDVFEDDWPGFTDHDSSGDYLPSSTDYLLDDLDEEGVDLYTSPEAINVNNDGSRVEGTFSQVRGRKWELGTDFYSDESMMYQIEYRCKKVKAPYGDMEDMVAEAFVQYAEMKAEGVITGEKNAAYYAQSAVNKMIDKYRYDNRQKRRSVDTVSLIEPPYVDIEDDYGSFEEWYEGLTKAQKAAVNDAEYKLKKNQPMGNALRKRLRRLPKPAIGTTVQRFGSTDLRKEYSFMRKDQQPEPREVTIVRNPVAKKTARPNKLREMIENGVSNGDLLIAIPHDSTQHREPQTVSEGKDMGTEIQSPEICDWDELSTEAAVKVSVSNDPATVWWNFIVSQKPQTQHLLDANENERTEHFGNEAILATLHNLANDSEYKRRVSEWKAELALSLTGDKMVEYKRNVLKKKKPGELERIFLTKERKLELSW